MSFFDSSFVCVECDSGTALVKQHWKVNAASMEFREGMTRTIQAIKDHQGSALLMDATQLGALSEDDQQWTAQEWLPQAKEGGCQKVAAIVSDDVFNKMSVEDAFEQFEGVETAVFEHPDEALNWACG